MPFPRHSRLALVVVLVTALALPAGGAEPESGDPVDRGETVAPTRSYAPDRVVVKLAAGAAARHLSAGAVEVGGGWFTLPVPLGVDPAVFAEQVKADPAIANAVVDRYYQLLASPPFTPDDPWFVGASSNPNRQWHMHRIDLLNAWKTTVGAGVRVAVLDTGVTAGALDGFCHPFVAEYDAVFEVSGPGTGQDYEGHGSHVAGTVAQCSGNGKWGVGVAPEARIMPVNVFWGEQAADSWVARGIYWAIANQAKVINLSLGFPGGSSPVMNDAIAAAMAADIVVVAAAGNAEPAPPVFYPASHPGVIAVGAVNFHNVVAGYSARGTGLEVVAPGGDGQGAIWQESPLWSTTTFAPSAGTSMAAPHVSGVAALLRARYPQANAAQVREAMRCSVKDLGAAGWDGSYGWGLVQAGAAVNLLGHLVSTGSASCSALPAGATKVAAVGISTGFWRLFHGSTQVGSFFYGNPGDVPFMGDWNCNGVQTPGLYRQSDGFVYLRNSNTQGVADITFFFGNPGDVPIIGDFNGNGCDTVSIYRPSEARFYIINKLGQNGGGLGVADYSFVFGNPGDVPFVGDWNGNGVDTPGLRRPSDGFVYLRNSNTQGVANVSFFYGNAGDVVFSGDWNANGKDSIGLYRPSNGMIYLRNALSTGIADVSFSVGTGIYPAAGDF